MIAIIIGSERGIRSLDQEQSYPAYLQINQSKKTLLEISIQELNKSKIKKILFFGGYHIEKVIKKFPKLDFAYDEDWESDFSLKKINVLNLNDDVIVINSNIFFRSSLIDEIIKKKTSGIFSHKNNTILKNSILFLKKNIQKKIKTINTINNKKNNDLFYISNLLKIKIFYTSKIIINDNKLAQAKFILGTKAETLNRLQPLIRKSKIIDQIAFTYKEWKLNKNKIILNIKSKYKNSKIVIRSSGILEDSWKTSNAGKFISLLNIDTKNDKKLITSINSVYKSYSIKKTINLKNQVLIQEHLNEVKVSGVIFTINNQNEAPYYILNYDKKSGLTDTVTSGYGTNIVTQYLYKNIDEKKLSGWIKKLIQSVREIEKLVNFENLDIEFAIKNNLVYIFQVRPLIIKQTNKFLKEDFDNEINSINNFLKYNSITSEYNGTLSTIYSNMSDWNPAEMIGSQPRPLSISFYSWLITQNSWLDARNKLGYENFDDKNLMYIFSGKPYIDIKKSFRSLLLKNLKNETKRTILKKQINYLKKNKSFHDKIEFEVAINCYNLDRKSFKNFLIYNLDIKKQISEEIIEKYIVWTKNLINNFESLDNELNSNYKILNKKINSIKIKKTDNFYLLIDKLKDVLNITKKHGVIPFSMHARLGFISLVFLKSLKNTKIFKDSDYENFLKNIPTISTQFNNDFFKFNRGKLSEKSFIKKYGHLRPSMYDIKSENYDELINKKFFKKNKNGNYNSSSLQKSLKIWNSNKLELNEHLKKENFQIRSLELYNFITKSIIGREKGKFEFSKGVDKAIKIIKIISKKINLSFDEIQYLTLDDLIKFTKINFNDKNFFMRYSNYNKKKYDLNSLIILPNFISSNEDVYNVLPLQDSPNFITESNTIGKTVFLKKLNDSRVITNKIVLIESADPGYDWIFSFKIKGLITKYGGAASHMAIRAAEYGIPAAIGCGEKLFNAYIDYETISLDCKLKQIKSL